MFTNFNVWTSAFIEIVMTYIPAGIRLISYKILEFHFPGLVLLKVY